jgi:hypothetical protein
MMRFDPTLIVKRLVVQRNDVSVYDEQFHEGVNVVRGENSSGKSTILNCIFYGLGGDLADWSEVALLCTRVVLEVELNGKVATLSREISSSIGQPMDVFGGDFESSLTAPRAEWVRYPYRRSPSQESFSQALFRLLGIPEVANDISGNITMNQVLRLLYSDQLSPVEELFRHDNRFDSPALRDAVGRLLAGAYEASLYDNEMKLRDLTREYDARNAELRSLFAVLGQAGHNLTLDWLEGQRRSLAQDRTNLQSSIENAERGLYAVAGTDQLTLRAQNDAYAEVQELQSALGKARQERDATILAVGDSAAFINSLEQKIAALNDASLASRHLGDMKFNICPACYAPLEAKEGDEQGCHLCKSPFDSEHARSRIVGMINDTALQLKQSRLLQGKRSERIAKNEAELTQLETKWRAASERLASLQRLPSSEVRDALRTLQRQSGYLDRQIEDLNEKARIITLIDQIAARKNELNDEIGKLKTENEKLRFAQQRRVERAYTAIADEVRSLLHNDLRRQDTFETAQSIQFDFAANKISVDGHSYFSASSRVILKSSFILAFFAASTKDPEFRYPRFVMIDTTEDKGMEPERSHNFQNQILRISEAAKVRHQIIYATAMISPDLDDEVHTVGKFSRRDDATLAIST